MELLQFLLLKQRRTVHFVFELLIRRVEVFNRLRMFCLCRAKYGIVAFEGMDSISHPVDVSAENRKTALCVSGIRLAGEVGIQQIESAGNGGSNQSSHKLFPFPVRACFCGRK